MTYSVYFSHLAENDLLEIFDYIAMDDPNKAVLFVNEMKQAILNLGNFPFQCKVYDGNNPSFQSCRVLICKPYKIFYLVIPGAKMLACKGILRSYSC